MEFKVVGQEVLRSDGIDKVTGQAKFVADIFLPGMLYASILRSTHAHARILRVDTSRAMAVPGVKAVVTGDDFTRRIGVCITDQYPLARDKVRFMGEPVAAVIATSEDIAMRARDLIEVEYEPLAAVTDPEVAARPEAPLIHEELATYKHLPGIFPRPETNIFHHYKLRRGDVERAFNEADLIVENRFTFPPNQHVALEPHGAMAQMHPGGGMTIWCSSQAPFIVRHTLARMFNLPVSKVRVVVPYLGGGFGGKSDVTIEPLVGVLAAAVPGRPVRLVLKREEVFLGTVIGRGLIAYFKTAVARDGRLLGEKIVLYWNGGGYGDYAVNIVTGGGHNSPGPYAIENLWIDSYGVYTNTPPTGAYRGYGHPEVHWACERQRDIIAHRLGISPAEFRLKNCLRPGKVNSLGQVIEEHNGKLDLCIKAVATELKVPTAQAESLPWYRRRGTGLAAFGKSPVMTTNAQSGAIIRLNEDGTATVSVGAVEMGQGTYTVLGQIAAEVLSLPVDKVHVVPFVDTEVSPQEWQTVASHTTWAVGTAVLEAARDALKQILAAAAEIMKVKPEELEIKEGRVFIKTRPEKGLPIGQLAVGYTYPDGKTANDPIIGRATFAPRGLTYPDPETGQGNCAADWTYGCQGAEIEVDLRTGEIEVLKLVTAIDPGRVINPLTARGQLTGAMVQAMGSALSEKLIFGSNGAMRNSSLTDYKIPTAMDMPLELKTIFIETPDQSGPFGARGLGEHGAVSIPPAIANALYAALGIDFYELPLTPDAVLGALKNSGKGC
ncbi:xanthine dehydrogenase family protein molybdopterin-binding subunit [Neomoorella thermoacetica]|uniref:xanthine dehydrogenase family protein molybdopterin-binding subunit n=1 Tax=Neomoorella thermoacetica TaxID=1525 RepID=UPI0008FB4E3A|nr:xanthine dehydrogenase family protein molybdopterin-binding subunit [Moorella thermoacetica]APC09365.1 xanthine dehydrogenase molybdenum-binding subunit [Moorella thermoacetica]